VVAIRRNDDWDPITWHFLSGDGRAPDVVASWGGNRWEVAPARPGAVVVRPATPLVSSMLQNLFSPRLLKKVQMQGDARRAE